MKKSDITKEKILTAAEQIFSEKGFAGARVDEIAEVSGVNKRMIYAHFESKENLYKIILNNVYGRLVEMESSQNMDLPADEVLRRNITNAFEYLNDNPNFISLVMHENLNKAKYVDSSGIVPLKSKSIVALQKVLQRGIDEGIFRSDIDINEIVLPFKSTLPLSGEKIPAIARSIVDLPLPFLPTIPKILPFSTEKLTPLSASKVSVRFNLKCKRDCLIVIFLSSLYFTLKSLTSMAISINQAPFLNKII